jgi:hypothetical protein
MAGAVFYALHPRSLWAHVAVSAVVDIIVSLKEGWTMKTARKTRECDSWLRCTKNGIISSWEAHLPSGLQPADESVQFRRNGEVATGSLGTMKSGLAEELSTGGLTRHRK